MIEEVSMGLCEWARQGRGLYLTVPTEAGARLCEQGGPWKSGRG